MFSVNNGKSLICWLKFLIILTILIGAIFYMIDITTLEFPSHISFRLTDPVWNWDIVRQQQEQQWDKSYFVNSVGCKMPSFPVTNGNIQQFLAPPQKPAKCKPSLTISNNNYMWIALNKTELDSLFGVTDVSKLNCVYQSFERKNDRTNRYDDKMYRFDYGEIVKIKTEFITVNCKYNGKEIYHDYHFFVPPLPPEKSTSHKPTKLSVMIIGIDSVSRLNFHRQMNKTATVVLDELKGIELFGYNKVADNTYPNLVPTLSGLDVDELAATCIPYKKSPFDKCHFIWDSYKQNGYKTVFAEDMASLGLFNFEKGGFETQPTDYNIRPLLIEMEKHVAAQRRGNAWLCLGSRRPVDIILEYITKFIYSIGKSSYFSFFWTTSYTHDFLNYPRLIDYDFAIFLKNLYKTKALNNTFLILMSDHGIRWGSYRNTYQGMMEERQPFLYLIPPKWFPEKYPLAITNLLLNRRKLTNHYDLYETLHDLIDLSSVSGESIKDRSKELLETEPMPRGISLFLPIPNARTCNLAGISPHWCTCHEKKIISTTNSKVLRVARMIVESINKMVKTYPQCQPLSLNSIADASMGISNQDIGTNKANHFSDITVRLQTKPGFAEFEATVRVHDDGFLELTGTVSRTNLYGKQSQCVDDYKIKLYCFCDSFM